MGMVDKILREFSESGVEKDFTVSGKDYRVFAYRSPRRDRECVRWNLYAIRNGKSEKLHGLTFGIADGVREAIEDVVQAASEHAVTGRVSPVRSRQSSGLRPAPQD